MYKNTIYINIDYSGKKNNYIRQIILDTNSFNDNDIIGLINIHIDTLVKELRDLGNDA